MPGMFLGELAALAGYGPLDLGRSAFPSDTPFSPIAVSQPPAPTPIPALPPAELPFDFPSTPPQTSNTPATSDLLPDPADTDPFRFGVSFPSDSADIPTVMPTPDSQPLPQAEESPNVMLPPKAVLLGDDTPNGGEGGSGGGSNGPMFGPLSSPNSPPVANNDSYTVVHDRQLEVGAANGLLANDSDPEGNTMGVIVVTRPANGDIDFQTQSAASDGSFLYLPSDGFVGTDTFT